jgi:Spy/CpxP family protein refolding chaperone
MKTLKLFICLMLSAIVLAIPAVASAQGRWWQSERFQKALGLTQEQITRIDGIYQATTPLLRAQKEAFDRREEKLSKVIADPKSDEAMVIHATDRLEGARNEMGRTRTLLIFRIRRVLTDEQHVKLNEMHEHDRKERERRERERKGKGQDHDGCDGD